MFDVLLGSLYILDINTLWIILGKYSLPLTVMTEILILKFCVDLEYIESFSLSSIS